MGQIVEAWLADKTDRGQASAKIARYTWNTIKHECAHLEPGHINRRWCRDYTARARGHGLSDATIRYRLSVIQAALRWNDRGTEAVVELPPEPQGRERHLSRDEAEQLIEAAASQPHIQLFIILALTTAARASALLELKWSAVDLDRGRIDLGGIEPGRKRRARAVPINDTLREALVRQREAARSDYVIEWAGTPVIRAICSITVHACVFRVNTGNYTEEVTP